MSAGWAELAGGLDDISVLGTGKSNFAAPVAPEPILKLFICLALLSAFWAITVGLSPGCGKYCCFAFENSDGEIDAPDSFLREALIKFL